MKIELEIPDLTTTITSLNNAIILYGKTIRAAMWTGNVPEEFQHFKDMEEDDLRYRFRCLREMYDQMIVIEEKYKEMMQ